MQSFIGVLPLQCSQHTGQIDSTVCVQVLSMPASCISQLERNRLLNAEHSPRQ